MIINTREVVICAGSGVVTGGWDGWGAGGGVGLFDPNSEERIPKMEPIKLPDDLLMSISLIYGTSVA
jgi:hypothetical protein